MGGLRLDNYQVLSQPQFHRGRRTPAAVCFFLAINVLGFTQFTARMR
jgi:hypothetical protein